MPFEALAVIVPELCLPLVDQVRRRQLLPHGIMYVNSANYQKQYKCSVSTHYF